MRTHACRLAVALLLVLIPAAAKSADCSHDLKLVADQLEALNMTSQSVAAPPAMSARAITQNRMATASENANAETLPPAAVMPSGAEDYTTEPGGSWTTGPANIFARAQSAWQAAAAANARGDEAGCLRELADAQRLLKTID